MGINFRRALAEETQNQKKKIKKTTQRTNNEKTNEFYNFGIPAVGTCINAPDACKNLVNSSNNKPVCFAIRPVSNWPFTLKVAKMNTGNCIYKQYANLYLTFDKDKNAFKDYLMKVLCPEIRKSFNSYYNQGIKRFDPSSNLYNSYNHNNIWNILSLYYNNSSQNDFLTGVNPSSINGNGIFVSYMIDEINKIDKKHSKNPNLDIYIRIHYSGDFYSEEYFQKWIKITDSFSQNGKIHFMAYTKEIENIKIWLNNMRRNLQGGLKGINIKLVFSEMLGFSPFNNNNSNTSSYARQTYSSLNGVQPCMKYTAVPAIPKSYSGKICSLVCRECMSCYKEKDTRDVMVEIF